ncbi:formyltetrahydrofolate deformylase [Enterobacter kobei]|uniref:formyltetrahydrofolate deformylase n=1 Tax=Enterobacter kobei TaxID=208224 RepID=UPI0012B86B33|nr:formyltetrahydrofolate deformylase [Enterobacter kobei]
MNFAELPLEVQIIAAQALATKLRQPLGDKKPAKELAQEVRDEFTALYSVPEYASTQQ